MHFLSSLVRPVRKFLPYFEMLLLAGLLYLSFHNLWVSVAFLLTFGALGSIYGHIVLVFAWPIGIFLITVEKLQFEILIGWISFIVVGGVRFLIYVIMLRQESRHKKGSVAKNKKE